jgi:hypothetical protein
MTNHWIDIKNSDCILIMGSNAAENHPVSFKYVTEAMEKGATLININSQRDWEIEADSIILATMKYSNIEAASMFQGKGIPVHLIGDVRSPRFMWNATHDGFKIGNEL